jgi:[protein-PII] uridylyltransferase
MDDLQGDAAAVAPEGPRSSAAWSRIEREFLATGDAAAAETGLTQLADMAVADAYGATIGSLFPHASAALAVGEYGRRALGPRSGAEILILFEAESDPAGLKEAVADFARRLWDAGVRPQHAVRTVAECLDAGEQNLEFLAALLDQRLLAGDGAVHAMLESKLPGVYAKQGPKITQHICRSARARHASFQDTYRHLRPDIVETPGGLRDVWLAGWLARLNPEHNLNDGSPRESAAFLARARCFLHYHAGGNLLSPEAQESIAARSLAGSNAWRFWMRKYYFHARAVFNQARRALEACERSESSLLDNFRGYRARLSNEEFTVSRERLLLRHPAQLETDPMMALRMLEYIGRHGVLPAAETARRLEAARPAFAQWCAEPRPLWPAIKAILTSPHAAMALRTLTDTGLMPAVFPEWANIEDLPPEGSNHRYTVDEHTLMAVERLAELRSTSEPARRRFTELLSEIDNPALVVFALLFHDTGKGAESSGPGDFAAASAGLARAAMARIRTPDEERAAVEFLIENQRELADVIGGRDLDDPATARLLAGRVGTIERLKMLAAMTYANLAASHPDAMAPWRLEQFWRAYDVTRRELTLELETDRIREAPPNLAGLADFIKGFPARYLRARPPAEIEAHLQLFELSRPTGVAVRLDRLEGPYRVTVVARDRPYLFASFAGAISSFGLDILKAEAFSNSKGVVLDTFVFGDPQRMLQLNPSEIERLTDLIRRVALGKTDAQRLMRNRPRAEPRKRSVAPEVRFDAEACETATLVEIVAEDRPGLLYSLAMVFSSNNCNIDVVLIDTQRQRAIDVFYVAYEGRKLTPEMQARLEEKLVAAC